MRKLLAPSFTASLLLLSAAAYATPDPGNTNSYNIPFSVTVTPTTPLLDSYLFLQTGIIGDSLNETASGYDPTTTVTHMGAISGSTTLNYSQASLISGFTAANPQLFIAYAEVLGIYAGGGVSVSAIEGSQFSTLNNASVWTGTQIVTLGNSPIYNLGITEANEQAAIQIGNPQLLTAFEYGDAQFRNTGIPFALNGTTLHMLNYSTATDGGTVSFAPVAAPEPTSALLLLPSIALLRRSRKNQK